MTNKQGKPRKQTAIPLGLNRWVLMTIACVSCIFNGPVIFNWPPLREAMEKSGAYAWRCEGVLDEAGTCNAQKIAIATCGNLAQTFMFVGSVFAGMFVDQFGPQLCSTLGAILFAISYMFLAVSSESAQLYIPAWIINGCAIEFCFMGLLTIPNLFPSMPRVSMAVLGTFRSLSMGYAIGINWTVKADSFPLSRVSWICCAIAVFWGTISFLTLPSQKFFLLPASPAGTEATDLETGAVMGETAVVESQVVEAEQPENEDEDAQSLKAKAKADYKAFFNRALTFTYLAWLIFFALSYSRGGFYGLSVPDQSPDVSNAFAWLSPLSFIPCPFLGLAADYFGMLPVLLFLNCSGTVMFICLVVGDVLALQWIAVILSSVLLSFLASQNYCWIAEAYHENVQGKLAGLAMCVAGLVSLMNTPLYSWATNENAFKKVDTMFLCFSGLNFALLAFMWINRKNTLGDDIALEAEESKSLASATYARKSIASMAHTEDDATRSREEMTSGYKSHASRSSI
eukprot:Gregarina_sp_Pseudo_9__4577@NODE_474_length_2754_cov_118_510129_g448_i0_p1_GENE_NODE_474_length_2754_cov_118_510129_g448_i0NODE_474_length_2754_cov_118_510129_g448_i0_p1_ORF_typecomplete_len513_score106_14MFS_1/PF07690_16/8_6e08MFS_1/PF07690_16/2_4e05Sugar_tr/PF00083_24/4_5e11Nodulinlike/PF06813_13/0_023Nodulinlike/PF06813_13/2_6DUF3852/PF12963_7/0_05DUF3852/PF12963_7/2e03TRAPgamma/PF07074_12/4_7e02TRAPgamma/PF07074_12/8_5e03TRAPgamma/PF07074_12/0_25_NODE_474_length_2754_cov_118_510129_g448_i062